MDEATATAHIAAIIPVERIASRIYVIRGRKAMLDHDLAELYAVETKVLNQAVRRNIERFPDDFMFPLTADEAVALRSHFVTLEEKGRGKHSKYTPLAFTEQGVAMLSGVLRSRRAVEVNIAIMRTFVRLREVLAAHEELARKVDQHDQEIAILFDHVRALLEPPEPQKKAFGFAARAME